MKITPKANPLVRGRILERFPGLPLETTYGMTEVSNIASYEYSGGPHFNRCGRAEHPGAASRE